MYNHFQYCEDLARRLKAIAHADSDCHYFRATEQTELREFEDNLSSAHGMIMIAIDGKDSGFQFRNSDSLMEQPAYIIIIAKQALASDSDTVFAAQEESKAVMMQVISRMLNDARVYKHGCDLVDPDSFRIGGFGPIGDLFYGVILWFSLDEGVNFEIKPEMWL